MSKLLTLSDVADHLQVSRRTVERLVHAGKLEAVYIGRVVRVRPCDIDKFLAGGSPAMAAAPGKKKALPKKLGFGSIFAEFAERQR